MPPTTTPKGLKHLWDLGENGWKDGMDENISILEALLIEQWGQERATTTGLTWGYHGGIVLSSGAPNRVADSTIALTDDATNYVERDRAGTVSVNQSAFSADKIPMAQVTTVSGSITAIIDTRAAITPGLLDTGIRRDVIVTTGSLSDLAEETGTVALGRGFTLMRIEGDRECRVRLYTTAAARTADAARAIGTDPTGEHGVIVDAVPIVANLILDLAPIVNGSNLEGSPSANIPYAIQNRSGGTSTVEVTFTRVLTEF